jgi:hypothetical protein
MKNIQLLPRIAFLTLALGTASVTGAFAQTTPTTPAPTTPAVPTDGGKHNPDAVLTPDERAQLEKDKAAALAANPDLQTEADNLKAQHEALKSQGASAPADAKQALHAQAKEHMQKLEAAMLKIDPSVAPILAKLKAAHKEAKHAAASA